jgi:hypothetical protein
VVGLGLRNLAHCPVEMNLMPDSTLRWQAFNQKKPYFIATVFRGGPPRYNNGMPGNEAQTQTNQTGAMTLICRAVSLSKVDPAANSSIAYTLENELQASPYFDPKATQLTGQINTEDASGTFTFGISAVLKNPLNL